MSDDERLPVLLVTLYGVFTNHSCMGVATRCLLLELLDVSLSELLVRGGGAPDSAKYAKKNFKGFKTSVSVSSFPSHWDDFLAEPSRATLCGSFSTVPETSWRLSPSSTGRVTSMLT